MLITSTDIKHNFLYVCEGAAAKRKQTKIKSLEKSSEMNNKKVPTLCMRWAENGWMQRTQIVTNFARIILCPACDAASLSFWKKDVTQWDRFLCLGKQICWRHCKIVFSKYEAGESCCSAVQTETTSCFAGNGFMLIRCAFQDAL